MDKTPPGLIEDLSAVASLAGLSSAEHGSLLEAAQSSEPTARLEKLATVLEEATESVEDPYGVARALYRLHRAGGSSQEALDELFRRHVDEVTTVLGHGLSDETIAASIERTLTLMRAPLFAFHRAALALRAADEKHFDGASIATDLRPALNHDPDFGPVGITAMLRRHHLRISYVDGQGDSQSFYVVMDDEDIAPFIGVLHETLEASDLLREFGESHGVHDISLR